MFFQTITENDSLRVVINTVLRVLLHSLACNQSTSVLQSMFATERSIVKKVNINVFKAFLSIFGPGEDNLHMSRYGDVPLFWVLFCGCSRIFGYHLLVKFDFFRNNPDFWVFILIVY